MASVNKPLPGSLVLIYDDSPKPHAGRVVDLLSEQFTYKDVSGRIRFAFYSRNKTDWRQQ